MPVEYLLTVEQVTVSNQVSGSENFPEIFSNIEHFRIKISNPLHFILGIGHIFPLDHFG
jgi:hypothetical protein